ncbi:protein translocase subunit SecDF [Neolewinella lacunae]|uniref:Multifunctional fusion protein n=1 Tax=Neolewinella lacunae TaxID=1517758 RepID=A0A923PN06_9BACT|nr:protein translocase subunit SecDF [Neolewinella lacunae]MBC6995405.1 protein translocase subunit SecDF [Neolewinella lacunae]MDN3633852.1 protein translocase subunit SecDF [Neolewinella lacunae]
MQGKGIIKFFLVVMLLVTAYQYFFIIPTNAVEADAADYAQEESGQTEGEEFRMMRAYYLDSISNQEVFSIPLIKSFTYQDLKAQQLNLGLDLKGGMSVVLQVDLREFLRTLARNTKDPTFDEAINKASQAQSNAQDNYIALFADAWREVRGDKDLASIFSRNDALRDQIPMGTSDAEVIRILRDQADEAVASTYELLKKRIDRLGVVQPNVSLDAERDLILVELPGIENAERARSFLTGAANLEFYDVKRIDQTAINALIEIDQLLERRAKIAAGRDSNYVEAKTYRYDTLYRADDLGNLTTEIDRIDTTEVTNQTAGPLFSIFSPNNGNLGPAVLGVATERNLAAVKDMLEDPEVERLLPRDVIYRWEASPLPIDEQGTLGDLYALYQLDLPRDGVAPLTGEYVTTASAGPQPDGQLAVNLSMNSEGARIWARMTTEAANDQNRQVAIVLDDRVVSAPRVNGPIPGGNTAITGGFNVEEADDLANMLRVGRLPARTEIIQESIVGPSLGAENISRSITALLIGFALVVLFMIFYYGGGGIVSIAALLLNIVFIFGVLASLGTVLTLPGIAGILLTIGMAVDANVIIFERIREELRIGKTVQNAIQDGFSNSYSAIIDANVTTLLIAITLAWFGLGPIKGFAVVLMVGVISSMFTAVLVGRLFIDWWVNKKGDLSFWTAPSKNLFSNINVDWMGKRKISYAISAILVVLSLASIATRGFDLSVDFKGGYSYTVVFDKAVNPQDLRAALATPFGGEPIVKSVSTDNTFNIVTDYLVEETALVDGKEPQEVVLAALHTGVQAATGDSGLTLEQFSDTEAESGTHITSVSKVSPTIADDIMRSALWAGAIGLLLIFLYLLLRFNKPRYSIGAIVALFHDSIIVMGVFSFFWGRLGFNMEVDQAFIAAILTVIGYSINDTVIVFDRIREFLNTYLSRSKTEVINDAISTTVSRTVITSFTTVLVVLVLFLFGGSSIKGFAFALIVGIAVGTYSSIFVATPIVHDLTKEPEVKISEGTPTPAKA